MINENRQPPVTLSSETIHVLRNHVGIILGFLDLVLDDTPEEDPRRRDLVEIKQAAVSAAVLLGVSRPPA